MCCAVLRWQRVNPFQQETLGRAVHAGAGSWRRPHEARTLLPGIVEHTPAAVIAQELLAQAAGAPTAAKARHGHTQKVSRVVWAMGKGCEGRAGSTSATSPGGHREQERRRHSNTQDAGSIRDLWG